MPSRSSTWARGRRRSPTSWAAKGRLFRQRMAAAGYDPARDTWAINELSTAVSHEAGRAGAHARDAMRGLFTGPARRRAAAGGRVRRRNRTAARQLRPVQVAGRGLARATAAGGRSVSPYVAWWSQEAYASCSKHCVGGAKVAIRSTHLNEYAEHPARLAFAGPAPDGSRAGTLRPRVLPADDRLLARRQGLRQQPGLTGADADADEPRGRTRRVPGRSGTRTRTGASASRGTSTPRGRHPPRCRRSRPGSRSRSPAPTGTEAQRRGPAARPGPTPGARPRSAARGSTRAGRRSLAGSDFGLPLLDEADHPRGGLLDRELGRVDHRAAEAPLHRGRVVELVVDLEQLRVLVVPPAHAP